MVGLCREFEKPQMLDEPERDATTKPQKLPRNLETPVENTTTRHRGAEPMAYGPGAETHGEHSAWTAQTMKGRRDWNGGMRHRGREEESGYRAGAEVERERERERERESVDESVWAYTAGAIMSR